MNNEVRIEYYLSQLDRELSALSVSQRAEIITKIKSHIREFLEKNPGKSTDQILHDLGSARTVAEPYLTAKGLPLQSSGGRPSRVLKWLAIGTVCFFALIFLAGVAAVAYFSPIIKIDEKRGHVSLLGGMIDINEKLGQVKVGEISVKGLEQAIHVDGEEDISGKDVKVIRVPFNTAKLQIKHSEGSLFTWSCKAASTTPVMPEIEAGIMTLNLDRLSLVRCEISLPKGAITQFRGVNGHMNVDSPIDDMDIVIDNGKVAIHPDPTKTYDFDVRVKNGLQDFFPRSKDKTAVKVKINVVNGLVKKE